MSMAAENSSGDRGSKLKALAALLAENMDNIKFTKDLPPLAKQYRETIREIEELEGASDDDEIGSILQRRESDGEAGAVRKAST